VVVLIAIAPISYGYDHIVRLVLVSYGHRIRYLSNYPIFVIFADIGFVISHNRGDKVVFDHK
jgi:hypothetical protein